MSDAESEAYKWQREFFEDLEKINESIENNETNDDVKKEYITCSAIWFDDGEKHIFEPVNIETGFVVSGHRHHNCFNTMKILSNDIHTHVNFKKEQGFLTNLNRFVDREEAAKIAYKAGQINTQITRLYSEDLY